MRLLLMVVGSIWMVISAHATPTNIGYSGAPGRGTCAASCHGIPGGTVQVSGFPTEYTPGEQYLVTVRKISGLAIKNFNASCRVATGSVNAGLIGGGQFTVTYNVSGETNGVHMSTLDHDSATFNWTAPVVGTGVVRLYVAAHQGSQTGHNTAIVIMAQEAANLPGQASGPTPADGATGIAPSIGLHWTAGSGATSHDLYYGTENPPPLLASFIEGVFFDPEPDPLPGTTYYWKVDARNDVGTTPGDVWSFTVMNAPGPAINPIPADLATDVLLSPFIEWEPGSEATSHDLFFGTEPNPPFLINLQQPVHSLVDLGLGTTYYWRVDERNEVGTTPGDEWEFTTMNAPDPATNPDPADAATDVVVTTTLSWSADPEASHFDVYFDTQNPPVELAATTQVTSYDPPGSLEPQMTYYWQIITYNEAGPASSNVWSFTTEASAVNQDGATIPSQYALGPIYPNPFNAEVTIGFALPQAGEIRLSVFDVLGREVAVLANGQQNAGIHSVSWNSRSTGSGIYLVRFMHPQGVLTEKVVALK